MGDIALCTPDICDPGESGTLLPRYITSHSAYDLSGRRAYDEGETKLCLGPKMAALLLVLAAVPGQLLFVEVDDHLGAAGAHLTRREQGHVLRVFPFD